DSEASFWLMEYNQHTLNDRGLNSVSDCTSYHAPETISWLNIDGVHKASVIETLGKTFDLHPLVMEDILNTDQRAKIEDYDGYLFIVLKMLRFDLDSQQIQSEQLSLVLGDHFVLSLQEHPGDVFDGVRQRLRLGRRVRFVHTDYLAYALIDAVVDHYFILLEQLGDQIEALEDEVISNPQPSTLGKIHHFKREMLLMRKSIWPLRETLSKLYRDDSPLIEESTQPFLRDVHDHTMHIMETIDTLRELLVGMLDLYMSSVSQRMNQVMKVLTIIATLFMPLTFIAGVYGMNFEHMPELSWPWAYPAALLVMLIMAVGLLYGFRRKGWL
ncbi:MAG: magnesium/cobalt transporter CorA, partial [Natronospirillum sp.]